jgi:hypothetical protein
MAFYPRTGESKNTTLTRSMLEITTAIGALESFEVTECEEFVKNYFEEMLNEDHEDMFGGTYPENMKENDPVMYQQALTVYADVFVTNKDHRQLGDYIDLLEEVDSCIENLQEYISDTYGSA